MLFSFFINLLILLLHYNTQAARKPDFVDCEQLRRTPAHAAPARILKVLSEGVQLQIEIKLLKDKDFFLPLNSQVVVFIMLINVKMPTNHHGRHFNIYEHEKYHAKLS